MTVFQQSPLQTDVFLRHRHKVGKLAALFVPHSGTPESTYLAFIARKLLQ